MLAVATCSAGLCIGDIGKGLQANAGGLVTRPASKRAYIVANAQSVVRESLVREMVDELLDRLQIPIRFISAAKISQDGGGPTVVVVDNTTGSVLTIEPEKASAKINVRALMADNPTVDCLERRVRKEIWRGVVYALGGGNTTFPHCVMKPVSSLSDLDALDGLSACPGAFNAVLASAAEFGIRGERKTTYLKACREGWAPVPTNDVQKAIWDKFHALPTEPIKIKPETKKVTD